MAEKTAVKLPHWDGKQETFPVFCARFKAYAKVMKCGEVLKETCNLQAKESDRATLEANADNDSKEKVENLDLNDLVMANLTIAFETKLALSKLNKGMTDDYPDGLAWKVLKELTEWAVPKDTISELELRSKLHKIESKKTDDPQTLSDKLDELKQKFRETGIKVSESEFVAAGMAGAHVCRSDCSRAEDASA